MNNKQFETDSLCHDFFSYFHSPAQSDDECTRDRLLILWRKKKRKKKLFHLLCLHSLWDVRVMNANSPLASSHREKWMTNANECNWVIDSHIHSVGRKRWHCFSTGKSMRRQRRVNVCLCITIDHWLRNIFIKLWILSTHDNWIIFREVSPVLISDWNWIRTQAMAFTRFDAPTHSYRVDVDTVTPWHRLNCYCVTIFATVGTFTWYSRHLCTQWIFFFTVQFRWLLFSTKNMFNLRIGRQKIL